MVLLMASPVSVSCEDDKEPVWKPATESVVYEVCRHDFENQPCVQRGEDEEQVYLYRAGHTPAPVRVLWIEEDGRWRVVVE